MAKKVSKPTANEPRGPRQITFTEESLGELRKRMKGLVPRDEVGGQGHLPGTPEPERRLPLYEVTLTAKSERIGYGSPAQPHEIEADHGEVTFLFEERVTRTVRVSVEADSYDDALERAQVKIDALVGGLHQLFADYQGDPACPIWRVKKL